MFKGATNEMQGKVFECHDEQNDRRQFAKTMKHLQIYAKKKFQHYQDMAPIFAVNMAPQTSPSPRSQAKTLQKWRASSGRRP